MRLPAWRTGEFDVIVMGRDPGTAGKVETATVTYTLANQEGRRRIDITMAGP